jgi:hypothetical protein
MSDRRAYRILDIDRAPRAPNNPRMLAHVLSAALLGVEAVLVRVEVDVASGLPQYATVGLPDSAVRESRERVRSAIYRDAVVGVLEAGVANHCAARTTGGSRSSANWRSTAGSSRCAARWPWASHAAGVAYARSSCRGTTRRRPWPWTVSACSPRGRCALPDGVSDVAKALGIGITTLRRLEGTVYPSAARIGGIRVYRDADVDLLRRRNKMRPT